MRPTLLSNIRLNDAEKFDFFQATLRDVVSVFPEARMKFRGRYAREAADYARGLDFERLTLYQELQDADWVAATRDMLRGVRTRSIFLYFEDHRLVAPTDVLAETAAEFDAVSADAMCYSFFRATRLGARNLLPLGPERGAHLNSFTVDAQALQLLGRISPRYYTFSLMSFVSVEHFSRLLAEEGVRRKIHSRRLSSLATMLFPYPGYRRVLWQMNSVLQRAGARVCFYHPSSPFNLERMWLETTVPAGGLRLAIPTRELFANCDDDNGADGESLVKRGLYPLRDVPIENDALRDGAVRRVAHLPAGERLDLTYHSALERIRVPPEICVSLKSGAATLRRSDRQEALCAGDRRVLYGNIGGELVATEPSIVELEIRDEVFRV